MVHAAHRQAVLFGHVVVLGHHFHAIGGAGRVQRVGQALRRCLGAFGVLEVDLDAFGQRRQRGHVEHARQAGK